MTKISNSQISAYRKQLREMFKKLEWLSRRCLFKDIIIKGRPHKVYRTCGNPRCKCAKDPAQRHGPYDVVIVMENGRQKQYSLRKDEEKLLQQITHYQYQIEQLKEFKNLAKKIASLIEEVIGKENHGF